MNYKSSLTGLKLLREIQWNNFICRCSISICAYYEGARTGKRVSEFSNDSSLVPSNDEYNKHGRAVVCGPVWRGAIANQSFSRSYYYVCTATQPRVYIVRGTTYFTESNPSPKLLVAETTTRSSYCFTDGARGLINVSRATTRRTTSIIYMILRVLARGSTANFSPNARCELNFKSHGYDIMRSPRYACAHKSGVLRYGESVCFDWRLITTITTTVRGRTALLRGAFERELSSNRCIIFSRSTTFYHFSIWNVLLFKSKYCVRSRFSCIYRDIMITGFGNTIVTRDRKSMTLKQFKKYPQELQP